MNHLISTIRIDTEGDAQQARRAARRAAEALGLPLRDQTRFATAVSEVARNALQYAGGGFVELGLRSAPPRRLLLARVVDEGGGIEGLGAFLKGERGPVTRPGSGLGLGLTGSRRIVDYFEIESGAGGTDVTLGLEMKAGEAPETLAARARKALGEEAQASPLQDLSDQNRALRDALAQQEFLVRELHHRVKNNLAIIASLTRMQAREEESEAARAALKTLLGRIGAFAAAHDYLNRSEKPGSINLSDQLHTLAATLSEAFGETGVRIDCEAEPVEIDSELAVELNLIVNEIVTNACKHAFPSDWPAPAVRIEARRVGERLEIRIADNGCGMPNAEETLRHSRSLGWRVIRNGVRKIGGDLAIESDVGVRFRISAPLSSLEATEG